MLAAPSSPSLFRRLTPQLAVLLIAVAAAWLATAAIAFDMGAMPGTMGLSPVLFVLVWTAMMAGMMLPSILPVAGMYTRTVREHRTVRLALFAAGYVVAWGLAGLPAYAAAWGAERLADGHPAAATFVAAAIFGAAGVFQLSPLKSQCLMKCRSTLGLVLQYGGYGGPVRDLRAGVEHGLFCVSCCWGLMLLLVAFGLMNLWAMTALAAVVVLEKVTSKGDAIAKVSGLVAVALAFVVLWAPGVAPGLTQASSMAGMEMTDATDSGRGHAMPDGTIMFPDGSMIMPDGSWMPGGGSTH